MRLRSFQKEILSGKQYLPRDIKRFNAIRWGEAFKSKDALGKEISLSCGVGVYRVAIPDGKSRTEIVVALRNNSKDEFAQRLKVATVLGNVCKFRLEFALKQDNDRMMVDRGGFGVEPTLVDPASGRQELGKRP